MRGTTTRDRIKLAEHLADHVETYGAPKPQISVRESLSMWSATGTLSTLYMWLSVASALFVISYALFHILTGDANYCSEVLSSFSGPTDHPAAVGCATQNGSN